jgi:mxaJ protein
VSHLPTSLGRGATTVDSDRWRARPTPGRAARLGALAVALAASAGACADREAAAAPARELRVCADPNNLPFSNQRGQGFENRLAGMVARDLGARVTYTWWAQRRGFFRSTLKAGLCDVVLGMPSSVEMAWATRPYYRSSYVFLTRKDRKLDVASFDDPALRKLRIGVQVVGDDGANSPPVHALLRRGMVGNLRGYTVYGDYRQDSPPARIVDAVARGDVDVAVVWGPLAGYYAKRSRVPLRLKPVSPQVDLPYLPFNFDISMGTRRGDTRLHEELERFIRRRGPEISRLLEEYGVPRTDAGAPDKSASGGAR